MATKKTIKAPKPQQTSRITVEKGSALAELVEVGEVFERAKVSAKTWHGLRLLNQPKKTAARYANNYHVSVAEKFIAGLPNSGD
jgi:hypothetical protein